MKLESPVAIIRIQKLKLSFPQGLIHKLCIAKMVVASLSLLLYGINFTFIMNKGGKRLLFF
jgi:hypothetical protein